MSVKGYKLFDENWNTKNDFHWVVGETYTHEGELKMCESGFHFCKRTSDLLRYMPLFRYTPLHRISHFIVQNCTEGHTNVGIIDFTRIHIAEVEALGTVIDDENKSVTDKIHIVREIPTLELLDIMNIGRYNYGCNNTGRNNIGNANTGKCNIGHSNAESYCYGGFNTGSCNIGSFNSGHNNFGNYNTGTGNLGSYNGGMYCKGNNISDGSLFCTSHIRIFKFLNEIAIFDKVVMADDISTDLVKMVDDLECIDYMITDYGSYRLNPNMVYSFSSVLSNLIDSVMSLTSWISSDEMSDEEKEKHPYYSYTNGYLKIRSYEGMWKEFWERQTEYDQRVKDIIMALPGFDPAIFKEITGIDVTDKGGNADE